MSGAFLIEEMRQGSVGTMPHCHMPDMFRRVIDLFLAGREDEAEREFNRYTPLFRLHGPHVNKEVLRPARRLQELQAAPSPYLPRTS